MPGGVCAVLDYETELMAEYVADMTVRLVLPKSSVSGAFRKFVNQILTSTRLPSTTILLGMNIWPRGPIHSTSWLIQSHRWSDVEDAYRRTPAW